MPELELPIVDAGAFRATAVTLRRRVRVRLSGRADNHAFVAMGEVTEKLHELALALGASAVVVDVGDLTILGARCAGLLIVWIVAVSKLPRGRRYKLRFIVNPAAPWQAQTLTPLRNLAAHVVRIEGEG